MRVSPKIRSAARRAIESIEDAFGREEAKVPRIRRFPTVASRVTRPVTVTFLGQPFKFMSQVGPKMRSAVTPFAPTPLPPELMSDMETMVAKGMSETVRRRKANADRAHKAKFNAPGTY